MLIVFEKRLLSNVSRAINDSINNLSIYYIQEYEVNKHQNAYYLILPLPLIVLPLRSVATIITLSPFLKSPLNWNLKIGFLDRN